MKQPVKRHLRWLAVGAALLSVSATFIGIAVSSENRLLRRATKVADCADWETTPRSYEWLSDHELLFARMKGDSSLIVRHDLKTGTETPLPKLTELMDHPDHPMLSPDRKWLLWSNLDEGTIAATLDGSKSLHWDQTYNQHLWLNDSRHWVIGHYGSYGHYGPDMRDYRIYAFESHNERVPRHVPVGTSWAEFLFVDKCMTSQNHLLLAEGFGLLPAKSNSIDAQEEDLNQTNGKARNFVLKLPPDTYFCALKFAPDGKRIAWVLGKEDTGMLPTLIHRYVPSFKLTPTPKFSLWISKLDGSAMREIGHEKAAALFTDPKVDFPHELRWLPDGKRVSFMYQKELWVVPVN